VKQQLPLVVLNLVVAYSLQQFYSSYEVAKQVRINFFVAADGLTGG
jgi:hypothetical protein